MSGSATQSLQLQPPKPFTVELGGTFLKTRLKYNGQEWEVRVRSADGTLPDWCTDQAATAMKVKQLEHLIHIHAADYRAKNGGSASSLPQITSLNSQGATVEGRVQTHVGITLADGAMASHLPTDALRTELAQFRSQNPSATTAQDLYNTIIKNPLAASLSASPAASVVPPVAPQQPNERRVTYAQLFQEQDLLKRYVGTFASLVQKCEAKQQIFSMNWPVKPDEPKHYDRFIKTTGLELDYFEAEALKHHLAHYLPGGGKLTLESLQDHLDNLKGEIKPIAG